MEPLGKLRTIYDRQTFNRRMTAVLFVFFVLLLGIAGAGIDLLMHPEYGGGTSFTIYSVPLLIFFCGSSVVIFLRNIISSDSMPFSSRDDESSDDVFAGDFKWIYGLFYFCLLILAILLLIRFFKTYEGFSASSFAPRGTYFVAPPRIESNTFFDRFIRDGIQFHYTLPVATLGALLIGIIWGLWSFTNGSTAILRWLDAYPAEKDNSKEAQLLNVIEEMSIAAGLPIPDAFILWDDDPNAFALGSRSRNSAIIVTKGLLDTLDRDELQAVVAHEMSHIRNGDNSLMTVVTVLFGVIVILSGWARVNLASGSFSAKRFFFQRGIAGLLLTLIWIFTFLIARFTGLIIAMAVARHREYLADATAVELTRNPAGLIQALTKLESAGAPTISCRDGVAAMCIIDPTGRPVNEKEGFFADLLATHPPIKKRIFILRSFIHGSTQ